MKSLPSICLIVAALVTSHAYAQNSSVAIGDATPKANAVLYLKSPGGNQGLIVPIVSSTGSFGEAGMIVYNSTDNKVYYNDGSAWIALGSGSSSSGTYSISISGNTLSLDNTAGPSKTVPISSNTPSAANQFLMWDGTKWAATALDLSLNAATNSLSITGDATPIDLTPYKQALAIAGNTLSISGGNSVTIPTGTTYTAGTGISFVGTVITNTGDADATDDITTVSTAAGDVTGLFSNLQLASGAVTTAEIADTSITDADVSTTAAIAGTKINPDFGAQSVSTTGFVGIGTLPLLPLVIDNTDGTIKFHPLYPGGLTTLVAGFEGKSSQGPQVRFSVPGSGFVGSDIGQDGNNNFVIEWDDIPAVTVQRGTGNVGIGNPSPTRTLDLNSKGASYGMSHVDGTIRTSTYNGTLSGGGVGGSIGTESNHPFFIYVANSGEKATFLPNGNVGIGTNTPSVKLEVNGDIKTANNLILTDGTFTYTTSVAASSYEIKYGSSSSISVNGFNTTLGKGFVGGGARLTVGNSGDGSFAVANSWNLFSDARLKKNVSTYSDALATVNKLRGVKFQWIKSGTDDIGFIAQEVEKVIPEIVFTSEETGYKSVSYEKVVAVLVEAIKEQQQTIEALQAKVKIAELQKEEIAQIRADLLVIQKALSLEASAKKK